MDVGVGGGAASLPLVPPAARLVGVDQSSEMLGVFAHAAADKGAMHGEVHGSWPEVADAVGDADVVVCHHVFYNCRDLVPFASELTSHAVERVVVELTASHPLSGLNELWRHFHGLARPDGPTASDAVDVLGEMGLSVEVERWRGSSLWTGVDRSELVAFVRTRLCLSADRDAEIAAHLDDGRLLGPRELVTLWWPGTRRDCAVVSAPGSTPSARPRR